MDTPDGWTESGCGVDTQCAKLFLFKVLDL